MEQNLNIKRPPMDFLNRTEDCFSWQTWEKVQSGGAIKLTAAQKSHFARCAHCQSMGRAAVAASGALLVETKELPALSAALRQGWQAFSAKIAGLFPELAHAGVRTAPALNIEGWHTVSLSFAFDAPSFAGALAASGPVLIHLNRELTLEYELIGYLQVSFHRPTDNGMGTYYKISLDLDSIAGRDVERVTLFCDQTSIIAGPPVNCKWSTNLLKWKSGAYRLHLQSKSKPHPIEKPLPELGQ